MTKETQYFLWTMCAIAIYLIVLGVVFGVWDQPQYH